MKTGIVDVGGGLRGIYAAGVFDWCLDQKILFDLCIGVSAGSANVVSYIAGQRGRNYRFYAEYSFRKKYMGIGRFLLKRSFIDLDYVYGTLSNSDGEYPVDYQKVAESASEMLIVATDARTGRVKYFDKGDIKQDRPRPFRLYAIPTMWRGFPILTVHWGIRFLCKRHLTVDVKRP